MRAQRAITKGEEITTRYFDPWIGQPRRLLSIEKNWNYLCNCTRCQDVTDLGTYFSAIKCISCSEISNTSNESLDNDQLTSTNVSDGYHLQNDTRQLESLWSCNKCGEEKAIFEVEHILSTLEEILDEVKSKIINVKENDASKLTKFIRRSFDVLHQYLHPNHFLIFHYKIWILELDVSNKVRQCSGLEKDKILDNASREEISDAVLLLKLQLQYHSDVISVIETLDPGLSISMSRHLKHQAQTRILLSQLRQVIDSESYSKFDHMTEVEKAFSEFRQASMHFDYPEK